MKRGKIGLHKKTLVCFAPILGNGEDANLVLIFADGSGRATLPDGTIGDFLMDAKAARAVIDDFEALGDERDVVIDYEHQTLGGEYAAPNGKAPAAGWITDWKYVPGKGLYAVVEWTESAKVAMAAREYRYHSPVFSVDSDGRVAWVHSVALTNSPATLDILPIAASRKHGGESEFTRLCRVRRLV